MNPAELHAIVQDIGLPRGHKLLTGRFQINPPGNFHSYDPGPMYLQIGALVADHMHEGDGPPPVEFVKGRKFVISDHALKDEVVQTALVALLMYHEHELREQFTYKGAAIFAPHFDVDRLARLVTQHQLPTVARPDWKEGT